MLPNQAHMHLLFYNNLVLPIFAFVFDNADVSGETLGQGQCGVNE